MHKSNARLVGIIDGKLRLDQPLPGRFVLNDDPVSGDLDTNQFILLGKLLKTFREAPPQYKIQALKYIQTVLNNDELLNGIFLSNLSVYLIINNGEGNCGASLDIVQTIKEIQTNGGHVSTYAPEWANSAGAYIWMAGSDRYTTPQAKFLWHTGHLCDLPIMTDFFELAREPHRTVIKKAIARNDKNSHEITMRGWEVVDAGLAKFM